MIASSPLRANASIYIYRGGGVYSSKDGIFVKRVYRRVARYHYSCNHLPGQSRFVFLLIMKECLIKGRNVLKEVVQMIVENKNNDPWNYVRSCRSRVTLLNDNEFMNV